MNQERPGIKGIKIKKLTPHRLEGASALSSIREGSVISDRTGKYKIKVTEINPEEPNSVTLTRLDTPGSESKISLEEFAKIVKEENLSVIPNEATPGAPEPEVVPTIDTLPEKNQGVVKHNVNSRGEVELLDGNGEVTYRTFPAVSGGIIGVPNNAPASKNKKEDKQKTPKINPYNILGQRQTDQPDNPNLPTKNKISAEKKESDSPELERERKALRLKELRERIRVLNEGYRSEMQHEEKAKLYSQLEKAQKEYETLEKELDTTPPTPEKKDTPAPEPERKDWNIGHRIGRPVFLRNREEKKSAPEPEKKEGGEKEVIKGEPVLKQEPVPTKSDTLEPKPPTPTTPPPRPESFPSLDVSRDQYLKAKRLRGNVFRGALGKLFGRTLTRKLFIFGSEEMDFGGKEGARQLERVRQDYQEGLNRYRTTELQNFERGLNPNMTEAERNAQRQAKIIALLGEEQTNIDRQCIEGIEKNMFEKMKTKWRQHPWTRVAIGALLGGTAAVTAGTSVAAAAIGARAVMGGVGTYVGVEALLEKTKWLGHKGLVNELAKEDVGLSITKDTSIEARIRKLPDEKVKNEAARLRMWQTEAGVSIGKVSREEAIALAIIKRDNELTAQEAMNGTPTLTLLSNRLAMETNCRNELVESEVEIDRRKKLARNLISAGAGIGIGWLMGGSLFHHPDSVIQPHSSGIPEGAPIPHELHHVVSGENTWNIIKENLDAHNQMAGMGEAGRTWTIDSLKDQFTAMPKDTLVKLGFSSGNANLIYPGDTLDMTSILNTEHIIHAVSGANDLSPQMMSSIVDNNAQIATWFTAHHQELSSSGKIFDSSVIEKILHGINPLQ